MKISKVGLDLITSFEGYHTKLPDGSCKAYWDATGRVWTIGWGCTEGVNKGDVWSREKADRMFAVEIGKHAKFVDDLVKFPVNQNQYDALVSFCYNCGPGNLKKLIVKYNKGGYAAVGKGFLLYTRSGGKVLRGLQRRRKAESVLFLKPATDKPAIPAEDKPTSWFPWPSKPSADTPTPVPVPTPPPALPKEKKQDVVKASRRLTFQERVTNFLEWLGLGGVTSFALLEQVRGFLTDWKTLAVLGLGIAVWLAFKYSKYLSLREVAEGRYVPSGEAQP
jgi:lysozyme